jgi:molybdopterin/thiamine biosynthesis adenylyltransferase
MKVMEMSRYSRQILFWGIGTQGQEKLGESFVVLVGCGALGSTIANCLIRAGVGHMRVIDRDFLETNNLQRQLLFTEEDVVAGLPKAIAAQRRLRAINSEVQIEGIVADFDHNNAEELVRGANLILDGLDNFETRFLINDVSLKLRSPWIYGGTVASLGMTANFIPGQTPCFRCYQPELPPRESIQTCDTAGIINSAPLIVGAMQSAEAIKILVGSADISRDLVMFDLWKNIFTRAPLQKMIDQCPACEGNYDFLRGESVAKVIRLCGQNAVQIWNPAVAPPSLLQLAERLRPLGEVFVNEYLLRFRTGEMELVLFYDGRMVVRGTAEVATARSFLARYIGT